MVLVLFWIYFHWVSIWFGGGFHFVWNLFREVFANGFDPGLSREPGDEPLGFPIGLGQPGAGYRRKSGVCAPAGGRICMIFGP